MKSLVASSFLLFLALGVLVFQGYGDTGWDAFLDNPTAMRGLETVARSALIMATWPSHVGRGESLGHMIDRHRYANHGVMVAVRYTGARRISVLQRSLEIFFKGL